METGALDVLCRYTLVHFIDMVHYPPFFDRKGVSRGIQMLMMTLMDLADGMWPNLRRENLFTGSKWNLFSLRSSNDSDLFEKRTPIYGPWTDLLYGSLIFPVQKLSETRGKTLTPSSVRFSNSLRNLKKISNRPTGQTGSLLVIAIGLNEKHFALRTSTTGNETD